ncbi:YlbF family regulator [Alkalihalobacillus oceani]|uniref:YlbF family regulator n=1 Tax=Halalkalibacter oceani TaxID=1653776 RepID=A0A9X2IN59_9BACI|nr:YlbF family regulator [Halalkalibacter oceani]MCM3713077.1 YlbF family regulator [Halalkalibacter oceani]
MLVTMSTLELMEETDALSQAILLSEPFSEYKRAKNELQEDKEAQECIRRFNAVKEQYEDVQRFGKYHPDYKRISTEIRERKREMDVMPTVVAFKKAERELESLLNEVSEIIARAVSPTIKVPTGNPFFDSMSCSGGCGSGGSCSCGG